MPVFKVLRIYWLTTHNFINVETHIGTISAANFQACHEKNPIWIFKMAVVHSNADNYLLPLLQVSRVWVAGKTPGPEPSQLWKRNTRCFLSLTTRRELMPLWNALKQLWTIISPFSLFKMEASVSLGKTPTRHIWNTVSVTRAKVKANKMLTWLS